VYLLIPAAGSGRRMGSDRNKLLLPLAGQPLLAWTLEAVKATPVIEWVGIIGQPYDFPDFEAITTQVALPQPVQMIIGGTTRQESVFNGLQALPAAAEQVLIHDGARCLATPDLFERCAAALQHCAGLIAAIPVKDTIKQVDAQNVIVATPDRAHLWAAQTPQGFHVAALQACHLKGRDQGWEVTDDAMLFEQCGFAVQIVPGEETNLKVTTPMDLAIAEFILNQRRAAASSTSSRPNQ
jgi:2-C-methyl-D-erythritol 4-phosphate cytidylyltransferase